MNVNEELQLEQLNAGYRSFNIKLLHKILSKEETNPALCLFYDDTVDQSQATVQTRSQSRNKPRSISAISNIAVKKRATLYLNY